MRKCSTIGLSDQDRQQIKLLRSRFLNKERTSYLVVPIFYTVVYSNNDNNIPLSLLKQNHSQINQDFSATNSDISKVPTSGDYGFANNVIGNARIQFKPLDYNQLSEDLHVRRFQVSTGTTFTGIVPLLNQFSPIARYLNIYIADLSNGLLGQAIYQTVDFTACCVGFETVGSVLVQGGATVFGFGRTLSHEIGHCFSLEHPWTSGCSGDPLHVDLPKTFQPNRVGSISEQKFCNHWNDVNGVNGSELKSCPDVGFELFFNYMEYVTDLNMVMFTESQATDMYNWVNVIGRTIFADRLDEIDELVQVSPLVEEPTEVPTSTTDFSDDGTNMILIILIISVSIIIVGIVFYFIWNRYSSRKKEFENVAS